MPAISSGATRAPSIAISTIRLPAARSVMERTKLFACAESLGGVESLVNHPAIMTHASVHPANRKRLGISDGLVRLSVGVEDVADLASELEAALS